MANIPGDLIPWEIIINIAPLTPIELFERTPRISRFMCTTEEYAISFLMSIEFIHTMLISRAPQRLVEIKKRVRLLLIVLVKKTNFISP